MKRAMNISIIPSQMGVALPHRICNEIVCSEQIVLPLFLSSLLLRIPNWWGSPKPCSVKTYMLVKTTCQPRFPHWVNTNSRLRHGLDIEMWWHENNSNIHKKDPRSSILFKIHCRLESGTLQLGQYCSLGPLKLSSRLCLEMTNCDLEIRSVSNQICSLDWSGSICISNWEGQSSRIKI